MTEAIATTKRKFYKALDALASQPTARPPPAKRVRRDFSAASITSLRPTKVDSAPTQNKDLPNFSPWSHEAFLARLKTFSSVSKWHPKPEKIGEVEWAKRGWTCVDTNTVGCRGGCGRRVVVDMEASTKEVETEENGDEENDNDQEDAEHDKESFEDLLAERYVTMIVEGHSEGCLWRRDGCKNDIYRVQVIRPTVWQPELRKRYLSLLDISESIQNVRTKPIKHDTPNILEPLRLLQELPKDLLVPPADSPPSNELATKALEIALHGWRGSSESGNNILHCDACFQRVGLWMYQPGYKPSHYTSSDDEVAEDSEDSSVIDLAEIHREHCPWRNPVSQKAAGSLFGLNASQILQRVVSTCAREQRRKSDQQSKDKAASIPKGEEDGDSDVEGPEADAVSFSRTEIDAQDKERESRLRRLKSLFTIKRRSTPVSKPTVSTWKPHM